MKFKINGKEIECEKGKTIMQICDDNKIDIPRLCIMEDLHPEARCRICIVDLNGKLVTSCNHYPEEGCEIITDSKRVKKTQAMNVELLMTHHSKTYSLNPSKHDLCKITSKLGVLGIRFQPIKKYEEDLSESVIRNDNKCINCGKCIRACGEIMGVHAIQFADRSYKEHVSPYGEHRLHDVACIKCGQCIAACPVGAIYEREHLYEITEALKDKKKHVVVQTAPSIRAALGEEFELPPGTLVKGKMVAALRRCGFNKIFDTDLGADMTIMEEASEFIERVKNNGPFPMITTCCPAWIKFMEHFYHDLIPNMSTCKSPHEMLGALTKSYYAKNNGIDPKDIVMVSVMPCTAKKFESTRPEINSDVDYVMTTRELAKLIRNLKIDFNKLADEEFDEALGVSTGAGAIFGTTGGVMEAALRTAYELATGKSVTKLEFDQIRGIEAIKEGSIDVNGKEIKFAVAHGGKNIRELLKRAKDYHFIEVMACPGGCIGGGGQPLPTTKEILKKRMNALYEEDIKMPVRKSHENPVVQKIYKEFLDKPLSKKAEKLLHTKYHKREQF